MGREVRRVALDFSWPLHQVWKGFINPHYVDCRKCSFCDGSGYGEHARRLQDLWYGRRPDGTYERESWSHNLTQDDVDALAAADRLYDFTRRPLNAEQAAKLKEQVASGGSGYWLSEPNGHRPTAAEVNVWSRQGLGHDSLNSMICIEARAKREGTAEPRCEHCGGEGYVWTTPATKAAYESWEQEEPPAGDGWQVWETVSEGSPITPVFSTPEALARWCANDDNDKSVTRGLSYERWLKFITGPGWAPSMISFGGQVMSGVEGVIQENDER